MKQLLSQPRRAFGIFIIWVSIHTTLLLVFSEYPIRMWHNSSYGNMARLYGFDTDYNEFWPLTDFNIKYYDLSEFVFYIITPLLIYTAVNLIRTKPKS